MNTFDQLTSPQPAGFNIHAYGRMCFSEDNIW
jgi:hypothetical protein